MGLFTKRGVTRDQQTDAMEQILREGADNAVRGLVESLTKHGIYIEINKSEEGSLQEKVSWAASALDEGIRKLELRADISDGPEKKSISHKVKRLRTMKERFVSMAEAVERRRRMRSTKE